METDRLIQFKTIVDTGGLMKASELLGISGGGLSKSIKSLEDEVGYKLFSQKGRGLEVTELGIAFYKMIPNLLKALDELKSLRPSGTHVSKTIKFATFEVFSTYFLADFISEHIPNEDIHIQEAIPGEMEKLISEGICDIGITYNPIPYKGIEFIKVSTLKGGVYALKGTKFLKQEISELPFAVPVAPLNSTPSGVKGLDGWPDHLIERKTTYKVEMMQTALELVSQGCAVAFLPDFIIQFYNRHRLESKKLIKVKLPSSIKDIKRNVYIIQRKGTEETIIIKKLAKALRQI
jgi:DNA-binding transcriptional LysR family regulator